jgi:serine protease Do
VRLNALRTRAALVAVLAATATGVVVLAAFAQSGATAGVSTSRRNAIVAAVETVSPAVVSITVVQRRVVEERDPLMSQFFGPFVSPFGRRVVRSVQGIGSGVIFDERGHILTNEHVVNYATAIDVMLPDGRTCKGKLVGGDRLTDIAVLQIDMKDLPYAPLGNSDDLMIGEWAIAIGNPFGLIINDPRPSVGVGVISATDRTFTQVGGGDRVYRGMIQTDAAINQGNSGGPLVNALGEVIGINAFIVSKTGGYQGLGFAIPISRAKRVAQEILRYGTVRQVWWGFRLGEVGPALAKELGLETDRGVVVFEVLPDSAAERAGLKPGDVITAINGVEVTDTADLEVATVDVLVGDPVVLDVKREERDMRFELKAQEAPR